MFLKPPAGMKKSVREVKQSWNYIYISEQIC